MCARFTLMCNSGSLSNSPNFQTTIRLIETIIVWLTRSFSSYFIKYSSPQEMPSKKEERFNISIFISPNAMNMDNDMDSAGEPDITVTLPFMFVIIVFMFQILLF